MKKILILTTFLGLVLLSLRAQHIPSELTEEFLKEKLNSRLMSRVEVLQLGPSNEDANKLREFKLSNNVAGGEMEPYIAINPTDSNNLVLSYMYFQEGGLMFPIFYTKDGGETWNLSDFHTHTPFFEDTSMLIAGGGDPMFAFDADGKLYFVWLIAAVKDRASRDIIGFTYWASSEDGGMTWTYEEGEDHFIGKGGRNGGNILDFGRGYLDKPWMDCDRSGGPYHNRLYSTHLFYRNIHSNFPTDPLAGTILRHKDDTASAFDPRMTHVSRSTYIGRYSNLKVDNQGKIHITYLGIDAVNGAAELKGLFYCSSTNGGHSFSNPIKFGDAFGVRETSSEILHSRENPAPNLAISPDGEIIHVVWSSEVQLPNGEWVIKAFHRSSEFGGRFWGPVTELGDLDQISGFRHSMMPVIASYGDKKLSIAWYSVDSVGQGDYIMVESEDAGLTFSAPISLSTTPTRFVAGFTVGDYCNLVRTATTTYAVWVGGDLSGVYVSSYDHEIVAGFAELKPLLSSIRVASISPQPARGTANIDLQVDRPQKALVGVFDINGKTIIPAEEHMLRQGSQRISIQIPEHVSAGVYALFIKGEDGIISKKLSVQ